MHPEINAALDLPQVARYLLAARGDGVAAHALAANARAPSRVLNILSKAAVDGITTDGGGEALVDISVAQSAFFGSLRTRSVFFRMLDQGFRRVPLRTHLGIVSASATAWIVGEGDPKPLSRLTLSNPALVPQKAVALIVTTDEIARDTSAAGQSLISQELRAAVADTVDEAFFDTIMAGASSNPSSGSDQLSMVADLRALLGAVNTTGGGSLFWAMSVDVGNRVALINDGKGAMSPTGGEFLNLPALVSGAIPAGTLRLVNASAIAANADSISLDVSGQVSIHMRDDPDAEAALVSMFQSNGVALKAEVSFGVETTRADAVAEITDIAW
ncbi:phage major capsid protein [Rhizobium beringeri]|uniref:phage major capsid family protein n=1 Tax=Rhizobium beringeri TaxID=3019934 RepID=UPI002E15519C|nr:phage major capsid protein [Rhizobium beringeri]